MYIVCIYEPCGNLAHFLVWWGSGNFIFNMCIWMRYHSFFFPNNCIYINNFQNERKVYYFYYFFFFFLSKYSTGSHIHKVNNTKIIVFQNEVKFPFIIFIKTGPRQRESPAGIYRLGLILYRWCIRPVWVSIS